MTIIDQPTRLLPVSMPDIGSAEVQAVTEALEAGWISGVGPQVKQFEDLLSQIIQRDALAVTNGTVALEGVLRGLGIGHGSEVIVPALTFVSPAAVARSLGANVVFVDVDPATWTIDVEQVFAAVTPRTRCVIAVDNCGHPCDFEALEKLDMRGIFCVEDAAEAHGSFYKGIPAGSFGAAATFSFFANKTIALGEGGAILTHHKKLLDWLRLWRSHGMSPETGYQYQIVGSNARMGNLYAALGIVQLRRWDELVSRRRQVGKWYDEKLPADLERQPTAPWADRTTWLYAVRHSDRNRICAFLKQRGVDTRPMFTALPQQKLYADGGRYPVATNLAREGFFLPTSARMTESDCDYVAEMCRLAF